MNRNTYVSFYLSRAMLAIATRDQRAIDACTLVESVIATNIGETTKEHWSGALIDIAEDLKNRLAPIAYAQIMDLFER